MGARESFENNMVTPLSSVIASFASVRTGQAFRVNEGAVARVDTNGVGSRFSAKDLPWGKVDAMESVPSHQTPLGQ
jgi:hypothetical protein